MNTLDFIYDYLKHRKQRTKADNVYGSWQNILDGAPKVYIPQGLKKCPYSEFFMSVFSSISTVYGEILCISPYSVRMRENTDHKKSEYGFVIQICYSV